MVTLQQVFRLSKEIDAFLVKQKNVGDNFCTPNGLDVPVNTFDVARLVSNAKDRGVRKVNRKTLKISVINAGGCVSDRLEFGEPLRDYVIEMKPDVFAILETMVLSRHRIPELPGYTLKFSAALKKRGARGRGSGGLAVYLRDEIAPLCIIRRSRKVNVMWIGVQSTHADVNSSKSRSWFAVCYCPKDPPKHFESSAASPKNRKIDFHKIFYAELLKGVTARKKFDRKSGISETHFCFIGDLNCRLGNLTNDLNKQGRPVVDVHKNVLMDFCGTLDLKILNVLFRDFSKTYIGKGKRIGGESTVDFALVKAVDGVAKVKSFRVNPAQFLCDHRMLELEWNHSITTTMKIEAPKYRLISRVLEGDELRQQNIRLRVLSDFLEPLNSEIMDWANHTIEFLKTRINSNNKNRIEKYIETVVNVSFILFQYSYDLLLIFGIGFHSPRKWHTEDWSPKLARLSYEYRDLCGKNDSTSKVRASELLSQIRKLRAHNRARKSNILLSRIEKEGLYSRTFNSLYKQAVGRRGVTDAALRTHFSKIFGEKFILTPEQQRTVTPLPSEYDETHYAFIRAKIAEIEKSETGPGPAMFAKCPDDLEVDTVIAKGIKNKSNGAPGRDRITWRHLGEYLLPNLGVPFRKFLKIIWKSEVIPNELNHDKMFCLLKNPEKPEEDEGNYRPIFLQSILFKVPDRVVDSRMQNRIANSPILQEEQGGFIAGRGTGEQSFALREIAAHCAAAGKLFYAAFVDCKSAFDRVARIFMRYKLHEKGFRGKIWRFISAMYRNTSVSIGDLLLDVECGVREGGISSPTCFIVQLDDLVRELKKAGVGIDIAGRLICSLLYADDVVLLAETPQQLQTLLSTVWNYGKKWHFSFGIKKCQVVRGPGTDASSEFFFCPENENRNKLEVVEWYKYLGIEETLGGNYEFFVKSKWKKVRARLAKTRVVGGHIHGLNPDGARKLYFSQVRPIIEFGATTIPYCDSLLTELEKMQNESLRQLFGFWKHTKIETMRILTGISSMRCRVSQLKICFHNKLKSFDANMYLKKLLVDSWSADRVSGLATDIKRIKSYWSALDDNMFDEKVAPFLNVNSEFQDSKLFNKSVRCILESADLKTALACLARSANTANGGSGQAQRAYSYLSGDVRLRLTPLLKVCFVSRSTRTLFTNVLSGCDFITPHSHKNLPKCRFCDQNRVDIAHLLFSCPGLDPTLSWLQKMKNKLSELTHSDKKAISAVAKVTGSCLAELLEANNYEGLMKFVFGCCCRNDGTLKPLRYVPVLQCVIENTATKLAEVQEAWIDAALV